MAALTVATPKRVGIPVHKIQNSFMPIPGILRKRMTESIRAAGLQTRQAVRTGISPAESMSPPNVKPPRKMSQAGQDRRGAAQLIIGIFVQTVECARILTAPKAHVHSHRASEVHYEI